MHTKGAQRHHAPIGPSGSEESAAPIPVGALAQPPTVTVRAKGYDGCTDSVTLPVASRRMVRNRGGDRPSAGTAQVFAAGEISG